MNRCPAMVVSLSLLLALPAFGGEAEALKLKAEAISVFGLGQNGGYRKEACREAKELLREALPMAIEAGKEDLREEIQSLIFWVSKLEPVPDDQPEYVNPNQSPALNRFENPGLIEAEKVCVAELDKARDIKRPKLKKAAAKYIRALDKGKKTARRGADLDEVALIEAEKKALSEGGWGNPDFSSTTLASAAHAYGVSCSTAEKAFQKRWISALEKYSRTIDMRLDGLADDGNLEIAGKVAQEKRAVLNLAESISRAVPAEALLYYSFDSDGYNQEEGKVTLLDLSGKNVNGQVFGGKSVPGKLGSAIYFDGRDDYVLVPSLHGQMTAGLGELSISMWANAKPTAETKSGCVFSVGEGIGRGVAIWTSGGLVWKWGLTSIHGGVSIDSAVSKSWDHVVGVWDGAESRIYVNGRLMETAPTKVALRLTSKTVIKHDARLGGQAKPYKREERFFEGALDELYVFKRALTPAEIAALYWKAM